MQTEKRAIPSKRHLALWQLFPFLVWGKSVTTRTLYADLLAGLTGAIIVLPQGIAYALIAGLPPEYGFYTAIVTPVIAGLFGSSLHLISGPTAAISIVVLSVVSGVAQPGTPEFISTVLTITLLAGLIQFALGVARLGSLVNFISHTVVIGFTTGAAFLIATSQLAYIFGIEVEKGSTFLETWFSLIAQYEDISYFSVSVALTTLLTTCAVKKLNPKLPHMLIGMVAGSLLAWPFADKYGIQMVGSLSAGLPDLGVPEVSAELFSLLLPGAFAVALLGLVEAVSIGRSIAVRSGQRIDGNQEFIGQGLSNIVGSCFSCYAGSGSFTRSGANYDAGAQTPLAALFAAGILAIILLLVPGLTAFLAIPAMGGLVFLIAWNLIDGPHIAQIFSSSRQETFVFIVTFFSTLFIELEFAIYVGVILSLMLYLRRTSKPSLMVVAPLSYFSGTDFRSVKRFDLDECPQLKIIRIDGSIFFGAVDYIQQRLQELTAGGDIKWVLLHCPGINFIDLAGANMLLQESERLKAIGGKLSFCGMQNRVKDGLDNLGFLDKLGEENFYLLSDVALEKVIPGLDQSICDNCSINIFKQCPNKH